MSDTDTSDEAAQQEGVERCDFDTLLEAFVAGWQECRRRCEARLETQAAQHIETLARAMGDNVRLIIEKKKLQEQMEEVEKRAYFAGLHDAFGAMEDLFSEETRNVLWNIHTIRKAKETEPK